MKIRSLIAAAAAVVMLAGCGGGSSGPDVAACKAAMKEAFATASADPSSPDASKPAACEGVDDKTIERLAGEIVSEALDGE